MSKFKKNILVLDGGQFSALSIVRSLGAKGLNITVGAVNSDAICKYSKYTTDFFLYPDPQSDLDGFNQTILSRIEAFEYALLIPVTELTTLPLAKIRDEIQPYTVLALSSNESIELVTDKAKTFALAENLGVPVPKSYYVKDQQSFDECIELINYPVVIKPARSIVTSKEKNRSKLEVSYAFNANELKKTLSQLLKISEIILQEYVLGTGVGIELIADNGKIIHAFQHQRMHELPLTGGGSCLRKSVSINPLLLEYAQLLIKALNWHGVAMVEFKSTNDNNIALMEINGRFWGSLPLAVASGSDFPWYLYQLLVDSTYPKKYSSEVGHISRKMKNDLYWYLQVLFKRERSPLFIYPPNKRLISDLLSIFHYKHHFDSFHYRDLKPGFIELSRTIKWFYKFTANFLNTKIQHKKHFKIKYNNILKPILAVPKNILFLCYGNINRSAAAECIMLQNKTKHTVHSAGFHRHNGRKADENIVKVANEQGYNMKNCSSSTVDQSMVDTADIIFVMEIEHIFKLVTLYPHIKNKIYLLGSLSQDVKMPLEIKDPYGKSTEEYQSCFIDIKHCINAIK